MAYLKNLLLFVFGTIIGYGLGLYFEISPVKHTKIPVVEKKIVETPPVKTPTQDFISKATVGIFTRRGVGSGTIIRYDNDYAFILTSNQIRGVDGNVTVIFSDKTTLLGNVIYCDNPRITLGTALIKVKIPFVPTVCPLGPEKYDYENEYYFISGYEESIFRVRGTKHENAIRIECKVPYVKFGGGLFNEKMELVGIIWGYDESSSYYTPIHYIYFSLDNNSKKLNLERLP